MLLFVFLFAMIDCTSISIPSGSAEEVAEVIMKPRRLNRLKRHRLTPVQNLELVTESQRKVSPYLVNPIVAEKIVKITEKINYVPLEDISDILGPASSFFPSTKGPVSQLVYWTQIYSLLQKIFLSASPKQVVKGNTKGFVKDFAKIDFRSDPIKAMYHLNNILIPFIPFIHSDAQKIMCGVFL